MKKILFTLLALCVLSASTVFADAKADLIGYWKPDVEELEKQTKKQLDAMPEKNRKMAEGMMKLMTEMFKVIAFEITDKEQIVTSPKGEEKKSYEVVKVDGKDVTIKVDGIETVVTVEKDKLIFKSPKMNLVLIRIDKEGYEKQKKASKALADKMKDDANQKK